MELVVETLTVDDKEATVTVNKSGKYSAYIQDGDSESHVRLSNLDSAESEIKSFIESSKGE